MARRRGLVKERTIKGGESLTIEESFIEKCLVGEGQKKSTTEESNVKDEVKIGNKGKGIPAKGETELGF